MFTRFWKFLNLISSMEEKKKEFDEEINHREVYKLRETYNNASRTIPRLCIVRAVGGSQSANRPTPRLKTSPKKGIGADVKPSDIWTMGGVGLWGRRSHLDQCFSLCSLVVTSPYHPCPVYSCNPLC